jgi:putative FmdB family regulatory protein
MPRYSYRCDCCDEEFEQSHSITVVLEDCHLCGEQTCLVRIPSLMRRVHATGPDNQKVGDVVKKHIEEAKEDVKREKQEMSKGWDT